MGKVFKKMAVGFVMLIALVLLGAFTLVLYREYSGRLPVEDLNQVVLDVCHVRTHGTSITCIEQKNTSSDNGMPIRDVYVVNTPRVLQTYRIENNRILNFRSLSYHGLHKYKSDKYNAAYEALEQLPNLLQQDNDPPDTSERDPSVTVVKMYYTWRNVPILPVHSLWNNWRTQKWTGTPNETPAEIEEFCQSMTQLKATSINTYATIFENKSPRIVRVAAALPDTEKYPAYLRAVPVFTEKELEAEKNTPLIDLGKTRENVHYAVQHPYTLFPIPPKRSPFPSVRKYTAGDKFKVNYENGCFLIETFVNGSLVKETKKGELQ